jgi:ribosomal protein L3 glutamine methyltransferase
MRSADRRAPSPYTLRKLLREAARRLDSAGVSYGHGTTNARDEAAWLVLHALGLPLGRPALDLDRRLTDRQLHAARALVEERICSRKPAAYLTHEAWLGEHRFYVDERAIVPRSYIAELLREGLAPWVRDPLVVTRALDMCTGSGCLAVLLALAFPRAAVDAVDVSAGALAVARRNVAGYRLKSRVRLVRSDLFRGLGTRRYDLIVANPPYVDAGAMRKLPEEYRREPRVALDGGDDGLRFVRRILGEARRFLRPGGVLVVETGRHRLALEHAFPATPFTWLETSAGDGLVFLLPREELPYN